MKREIKIDYHWNLEDFPDIGHEELIQLEEHAEERILKMRAEKFTSGELHFENKEISVYGWWEFNYIHTEEA